MANDRTSRRGDFLIPLLTVVADAVAVELAFLFSYWLRFRSSVFDWLGFVREDMPPLSLYLLGSIFVILVWLMLFEARKMYGARRNVNLSEELVTIIRVVTLGMLIVMSATFFYRAISYSRVVFGLLWGSSIVFIFIGRAILQAYERSRHAAGQNLQPAVIIGSESQADQVYTRLNRHMSFGFDVLGYFADAAAGGTTALGRAPYLGPIGVAAPYIREHGIELAFIAVRSQDHPRLFELIGECEGLNIEFMMVPDVLEVLTSQVKVRELEGIPFLRIKSIPFSAWGRIAKRAFDLAVAGVILLLTLPLTLLISLLIKLDSRGPVLFRQQRVGLDGKEFAMLKFRSMRVGSEKTDTAAGLGIKNDPRRTRIGRFLRTTSLDELPQLLNVLKGEMSLVGPRPERTLLVKEFQEVVPKYLDRHRVKTGMTGWAQVNGLRGDTSIEDRIKYDLYYIENWSFGFDFRILMRTLRAALHTRETE